MSVTINAEADAPIIDGLMFNPLLQYVPNRWNILAIERLRKYRIGAWQPRFYAVPTDFNVAIPAGATVQAVVKMQPGTDLVALNFATVSGSVSDIMYRLRDPDTEYTYVDTGYNFTDGNNKFEVAANVVPVGSGGVAAVGAGTGLSGMRTCFLSHPYSVRSGMLTVELSSLNVDTAVRCQLLLYCMEPFTTDLSLAKGAR
jgi:hypothetical protein